MLRIRTTTLAAAAVAVTASTTGVARAETDVAEPAVASNCLADTEKRGDTLVFEVDWAIERPHVKAAERWEALREARSKLLAFDNDRAVEACWLAYPQYRARIDEISSRFVQPALDRAQTQLDQICTHEVTAIILRKKGDVDAAMASNRLSDASKSADELEYGLTHGDTITNCAPMREQVHTLLNEYVPAVRTAIALPKITANMESALAAVDATWRPTSAALETGGKTIVEAPTYLTTNEGKQTFRDDVAACRHFAGSLRSLGIRNNYALGLRVAGRRLKIRLVDAESLCNELDTRMDELLGRVADHNVAYAAEQKRKWEWTHIKGWGMWRIYNRLGRPTSTTNVGDDEIAWTYEAQPKPGVCTTYRFSARGAERSRRKLRCPAVARND